MITFIHLISPAKGILLKAFLFSYSVGDDKIRPIHQGLKIEKQP
jgi:hypothetical protein